jgi:amino acid transporter
VSPESAPKLERAMGLGQAAATNIIGMVGVGPFLTIPFMLAALDGPHIIYAWVAGAVLSLADGLVYAQLGAALPGSGGPYLYLREAFKPLRLGGLMGFVFLFQILLVAPLSIAGGAVGFADYLGFYWSSMGPFEHHLVSALVVAAVVALLYRDISAIGRLSVVMLVIVFLTTGWVIVAGLPHFSLRQAFDFPPEAFRFDSRLLRSLGAASVLAMYSYGGYNQVCNIAGEVRAPEKTVPRSIVLSIVVVAAIYVAMSIVIVGLVPWREAAATRTIASLFIARTFDDPASGRIAGGVMTALILFVAASSLFAFVLGYSRMLYAAAAEGQFFRPFARLHPTKLFPYVSLVVIGAASIPFCFFTLGQLVSWLMQVQILLLFSWQCVAVLLLHRYRKDVPQPFVMWLYPLPALVSLALWLYIFATGPIEGIVFSFSFFAVAVAAYFLFEGRKRKTPKGDVEGRGEPTRYA